MKTLINNIELISFSYMNSNNNTIDKFGIEYNYIALAMNNILGFTNNNIKNINIDKTNAIAIDWNWGNIIEIFGGGIGFEVTLVAFLIFGGPVGITIFLLALTLGLLVDSLLQCIYG